MLTTMRYLQAGVLLGGAALYLGVAVEAYWLSTTVADMAYVVLIGGWNVLLIIVAALVLADSRRKARAGKTYVLATDLLIVKLAAIPFFLINFTVLTWIAFFGSTLALYGQSLESGGYVALAAAGAIALTYVAMLTTSTYGWATIAQLRRDGRIGAALGCCTGCSFSSSSRMWWWASFCTCTPGGARLLIGSPFHARDGETHPSRHPGSRVGDVRTGDRVRGPAG